MGQILKIKSAMPNTLKKLVTGTIVGFIHPPKYINVSFQYKCIFLYIVFYPGIDDPHFIHFLTIHLYL